MIFVKIPLESGAAELIVRSTPISSGVPAAEREVSRICEFDAAIDRPYCPDGR
jgi:hypothetical protein